MLKIQVLFNAFLLFSFLDKIESIEKFDYQKSITLLNGNIFIIYKKGIIIYDSSMKYNISTIENFAPTEYINETNKLYKISISRFPEDDYGFIICTINDAIYIFDCEGNRLKKENYSNHFLGKYYTLVPIKRINKIYEYMVGFAPDKNNINLFFFKYDNSSQINYMNSTKFALEKSLENNILSCQLMLNTTERERIIVCFIGFNSPRNITTFYINTDSYSLINTIKNASFEYSKGDAVYSIKTEISLDKTKSLVCFNIIPSFYCSIFFVQNNSFSEAKQYLNCKNDEYSLNIYYMRESNQYFVACSVDDSKFNIISMDGNFNINVNYSTPLLVNNIKSFSIIFSYDLSNFILLIGHTENSQVNIFNFSSTEINAIDKRIDNIELYMQKKQNISSNILVSSIITQISTQIILPTIQIILPTTQIILPTTQIFLQTTQIIFSTIINNPSINIITQIPVISLPTTSTTQLTILNNSSTMIISPTSSFINSVSSQSAINSAVISDILTTVPNIVENTLNNKENFITIVSSLTNINPSSQEINQIKVNVTKENLIDKISEIIDEVEVGKIYEKKDDDFSIYIYPTNYSHSSSTTHVNFSQCEKVLRNHYKIPDSSIMTFLQIELKNDDSNSLINQVEYQAYDGTKKLLDLSLC